jgi:hypothetical protein
MFGGLAFMTGGDLSVGGYGGGLIADRRAGHGRGGSRAGCAAFRHHRPVRGIVVIDSAVLDDKVLDRWIGQARSYVAGLPPK